MIDDSVPPAVAAALAAELAALAPDARRVLDAAAVAGDPFEPEPGRGRGGAGRAGGAARARRAARSERWFAPRLLRAGSRSATPSCATPSISRLRPAGGSARTPAQPTRWSAAAPGRSSAPTTSSTPPDPATRRRSRCSPRRRPSCRPPRRAIAARFHAAALRLLPDRRQSERAPARSGRSPTLRPPRAIRPAPAQTLLDALQTAGPASGWRSRSRWPTRSGGSAATRTPGAGCRSRSVELPAEPSPDRIRLRLALGLTALLACDLREAQAQASDARDDARAIGDPVFELAALAGGALATASAAQGPDAARRLEESRRRARAAHAAAARDAPAGVLDARPGAPRARAVRRRRSRDLRRGAAIAEQTGRERVLLVLTIESVATLMELGRLAEATAAAEEGVERARLAGNPRMLLWAQSALASARLAAGDVAAALRHGEQAAAAGTRPDFHAAGQPGWCLGAALTAAGNPERAVPRDARRVRRSRAGARPARRSAGRGGRSRRGAARAGRRRRRRGRARPGRGRRGAGRHRRGDRRDGHRPRRRPARPRAPARGRRRRGRRARGRGRRAARSRPGRCSPRAGRSPPPATARAAVQALVGGRVRARRLRRAAPAGRGRPRAAAARPPRPAPCARTPAAARSPRASARSPSSSPPGARTARSPSSSCSAPARSRRTCATSTPSSGSARGSSWRGARSRPAPGAGETAADEGGDAPSRPPAGTTESTCVWFPRRTRLRIAVAGSTPPPSMLPLKFRPAGERRTSCRARPAS